MVGEEIIDPQSAGPSSSGLKILSLNMTKAGMEGLDKDKINAIVAEASKGSKFYEAKQKNQVRDILESMSQHLLHLGLVIGPSFDEIVLLKAMIEIGLS